MDEFQDDRPSVCRIFVDEIGEHFVGPGTVLLLRLGVAEPLRDQKLPVVRLAGIWLTRFGLAAE